MNFPDGELVKYWNLRATLWQRLLAAQQKQHAASFGRTVGPAHWIGSPELGPWSWYGFFWEQEKYWFGYGHCNNTWRPLIEADTRNIQARSWRQLANQLPDTWKIQKISTYLRLWSPDDLGDSLKAHERWFRNRAQELHEYALGET